MCCRWQNPQFSLCWSHECTFHHWTGRRAEFFQISSKAHLVWKTELVSEENFFAKKWQDNMGRVEAQNVMKMTPGLTGYAVSYVEYIASTFHLFNTPAIEKIILCWNRNEWCPLNEYRMTFCTIEKDNSDIHTASDEWQVVSSCKINLAFDKIALF